jgi:hypothetical protein
MRSRPGGTPPPPRRSTTELTPPAVWERSTAALAPKWSHWALVLYIKRALCGDGKDIRDYVEADELILQAVEERTRRERERVVDGPCAL